MYRPDKAVIPTGAKALETTAPAAAAVAATTLAVSSPEAKTARLIPEQEQVLLRFFGAQDRVDREEALLLARQVRILSECIPCRNKAALLCMACKHPPACSRNTCSCLDDH